MVAGATLVAATAKVSALYVKHRHAEQLALLPLIGSARHVQRPIPIGDPASIEFTGAQTRTTERIRNPRKQPTVTSRADLAVIHTHSADQLSPCRATEGEWHLIAGGTLTLDPAGRARFDGNAGRSEIISWLCYASGQIEIYLPTGPVSARQDVAGNQLTSTGIVLATR
jgi:hypothetical protein